MVLLCTAVVTTAFVDEREHTAIARCRSLPAMTYHKNTKLADKDHIGGGTPEFE